MRLQQRGGLGGVAIEHRPHDALVLIRARGAFEHSAINELTTREREVLVEIAKGSSNAAIAETLFLTKRAVEKHINAIFLKLDLAEAPDVSRRVKAALMLLAEDAPVTPVPDGTSHH